jgi:ubiquitin-protein ligase
VLIKIDISINYIPTITKMSDDNSLEFLKSPPTPQLTKIMLAQIKKARNEKDDFMAFAIDETEPRVFYFLVKNISGDEDEFVGGEFIFKLVATNDFPHKPPKFFAVSRNGVYVSGDDNVKASGKRICISIGEYHEDKYRPALGMYGFAKNVISGLIGWRSLGEGYGLLKTTIADKKVISAESRALNEINHAKILAMIESQNK